MGPIATVVSSVRPRFGRDEEITNLANFTDGVVSLHGDS